MGHDDTSDSSGASRPGDPSRGDGIALDRTETMAPSRLIDGKYRLGRCIGEGGMGAVYEAEHTGLGVRVAIKLLNEAFTTDHKALSRFGREARAAAAIRHPNVVEVTDTGTTTDGIPFIVMELLRGESLSSLLRRQRVLPPELAVVIAGQILSGLAAAHVKGVIHRDLKPGNILLVQNDDGSQQVKILDFGISKFYFADAPEDVTAAGAVIGTPRFMAPEQAIGQPDLDGRVDIYATGVLLYRMVTGRLPFTSRSHEEVIQKILQGNPRSPRDIRPELPESLDRALLKAMAVNREDRYADARAFYQDLELAVPTAADHTLDLDLAVDAVADDPTGAAGGPRTGMTDAPTFPPPGMRTPTPAGPHPTSATPGTSAPPRRPGHPGMAIPLILLLGLGGVLGWFLWARRVAPPPGAAGSTDAGAADQLSASSAARPSLHLGITRYMPRGKLEAEHAPLLRYLSRRLGRPVNLDIQEDYVDLASRLTSGKLHVAALSAYGYVRAKRKLDGLRLVATHVTKGGTTYEGFVVARAEAGIRTLADLEGRVFCYVSPTSTSGYLYPRALFRKAGHDPDALFKASRFTGDHLSALKALSSGGCDGAAVFAGIFFEAREHGLTPERFTVVDKTDRIPYDAYCAGPHLSESETRSVREALLALSPGTELARKVLGPESRITGFAPARDRDYDPVRQMEKYLDSTGDQHQAH